METLLKARRLVDVVRKTVVDDPVVLVSQGVIRSVDTRSTGWQTAEEHSGERQVVELPGATLLPGLINSHIHGCFPGDGSPFSAIDQRTDATLMAIAIENARRALFSGVTTLRDCGDRNGVMGALRNAIAEGYAIGPRMVLSGAPLTMTGGHCHSFGGEADGVDTITRAVRQRVKEGADFIKIMATGGSMGGDPAVAAFDLAELQAAVTTAHRLKRKVSAHCRGLPGMELAIDAGVDHMEHASFELPDGELRFDDRIAARMAEHGVVVTPTIGFRRDYLEALTRKRDEGALNPLEKQRLECLPRQLEQKYTSLQGMLKAGVVCVAGDDAGLPYTRVDRFYRELETMVLGGMPSMQVLAAASCIAAEAMGLGDRIGSVDPGKAADIIAVDGDPLQDVSTLGSVRFVMQGGTIVFRAAE